MIARLRCLASLLLICLAALGIETPTVPDTPTAPPAAPESPSTPTALEAPTAAVVWPTPLAGGGKVFVLPLRGPIDKSMMMVFRRAFRLVSSLRPDAVILDIDTPGGALRETEEIGAWLLSLDVPVFAFVNTHAQSAGAILSLATDKIFMHPSGRIGSALPIIMAPGGSGVVELPEKVEEKVLSDTRALVRAYAQQKGHNPELAMAMVDPSIEFTVGDTVVCPVGKLLNLTATEATQTIPPATTPLLATAIVADLDELLAAVGLATAQVVHFVEEPAEQLARYIVGLGPLLFALGILGIFIELKTPGFGLPGIIGIVMLVIFFFGHYVAGLAGVEDIALVAIGLALLAVEIFVIPGFGVAGILGLLLITAGTMMAMIPHLPKVPVVPNTVDFDGPTVVAYLQEALLKFIAAGILAGVGAWLLARWLPKTGLYSQLVLNQSLTQQQGYVSHDTSLHELLGQQGVAITLLRPAGIATFGDRRIDVVTTGDLIDKGAKITVVEVGAGRVVVEQVQSPTPPAG